jgi:hypothetical protein
MPSDWPFQQDNIRTDLVGGMSPRGIHAPLLNQVGSAINAVQAELRDTTIDLSHRMGGHYGDGSDIADALEEAFEDAAAYATAWADPGRADLATRISLPRIRDPEGFLTLSRTVTVPFEKGGIIGTDAPLGVRIDCSAIADGVAFHVEGGDNIRAWGVHGLVLDTGRITIGKDVRGHGTVWGCLFYDADDFALHLLDTGLVNLDVFGTWFTNCDGAMGFGFSGSDIIQARWCSIVRGKGVLNPDVLIGCTSARLEFVDFETRLAANAARPYLQVLSTSGGGLSGAYHCRFGPERSVDGSYDAPQNAVVIGPLEGLSNSAQVGFNMDGCWYAGTNGTPSATIAQSPIRITCPVRGISIRNPRVEERWYGAFIQQDYEEAGGSPPVGWTKSANTTGNRVIGLMADHLFPGGLFSATSAGWATDEHPEVQEQSPPQRITTNLCKETDLLTSGGWAATNVTPTNNGDGTFTLTKSAAGNGLFSHGAIAVPADGPHTWSVELAAGTLSHARLAVYCNTLGQYVTPSLRTIRLTSDARRYAIVADNLTAGHDVRPRILPGKGDDTTVAGTITAARPQFEAGVTPSAYLANPTTTVRARLHDEETLGGLYRVSYGAAAPTSGYWRLGDVVINVAQTGGGPFAWQCIATGSPGTWVGCGSPSDIASVARHVEDFLTGTSGAWTGTASGWAGTASNVAGHPGRARLTSTAVAGTLKAAYPKTATAGVFAINALWEVAASLVIQQANSDADAVYRLGWAADAEANPSANWVGFQRLGGEANWRAVTRAAGTETVTDLGVAQGTSYFHPRVRRFLDPDNGDTPTIGFSIDGGAEIKQTTNIPANGTFGTPFAHSYNGAAAASKIIDFDLIAMTVLGLAR